MSNSSCPTIGAEMAQRFGYPVANAGTRGMTDFADPFLMDSAMFMPRTLDSVWDYCFFLYYLNGNYRQAWKRVTSYFLTSIKAVGEEHGDQDEQRELQKVLVEDIDIFGQCGLGGQEVGAYGNSFFTHYIPFDRTLVDTRSDFPREYSLATVEELGDVKYDFKKMTYNVVDPTDANKATSKRRRINLRFRDRPSRDVSRFRIVRLDPREIVLVDSPMQNRTRVVRQFSQDFLQKIKTGDPFYCNDVPIEHLEAVSNDYDFVYHPDHVFHLKMPTIHGLRNNGWGIPETMANYRALHHLQVLRRIDEAVGMDYILPFRAIVPDLKNMGDPAVFDTLLGAWKGEMGELIARRRKDPYAIHALPFPVAMQELGGGANGRMLVQAEAIEFHNNALLDSTGVPIELYKGTMQVQNMPTAMRLFEGSWQFLYYAFNKLVKWTANAVQDMRRAPRIEVELAKPTMADDLEERTIYLQLAASGEISRDRAYSALNIMDALEEKKKRMREDMEIETERTKMEKQFQQQQQAGTLSQAPGAPGAEGGAGYGNPPGGAQVTPLDMEQKAQDEASKLLQIQDNGTRSRMLQQLKSGDPALYAMVKQKMEEARSGAASEGRKNVGAMLQQGGGQ